MVIMEVSLQVAKPVSQTYNKVVLMKSSVLIAGICELQYILQSYWTLDMVAVMPSQYYHLPFFFRNSYVTPFIFYLLLLFVL